MNTRQLEKLFKKTSQYGLRSTEQVVAFLKVAEAGQAGITYAQMCGSDDSQSSESKSVRTQIRKLSTGYNRTESKRAEGLDLVQVVDEGLPTDTWGRNYLKVVTLTTRGKRLHNQIQKIMG